MQVRFVEDNWENPALGAWGLGWEVWMDGARSPHAGNSSSSDVARVHAGCKCRLRSAAKSNAGKCLKGSWYSNVLVWRAGQEVTQFTYFQQAGGQPLPAPAVEITYGLERILMALQARPAIHHMRAITGFYTLQICCAC